MIKPNYERYYSLRFQEYFYPEHVFTLKRAYYKSASHQERKFAAAYPKFVRPCRNITHLPSSYDDIYPSRWKATSWKDKTKFRKQWMR